MARSIPVIYQQLLAAKTAQTQLNSLNSNSQVSIWNLWLWITAVGQNLFEQLCDLFQTNMETLIANAPAITAQWIVQMCKYFQYNAANPQVLQVNVTDTYPFVTLSYPVLNSSYNQVTQAACVNNLNGQVIIKVTGASGPLDGIATNQAGFPGPIAQALISYLNLILPPNIQYLLINDNADLIYIQAQIYYNASYSGVIQANTQAAITAYLQSIPFNGVFTLSALEEAILGVAGVNDLIFFNVYWRTATDSPPPAAENKLVSNYTVAARNYQTYAGYVIPETQSGYTLSNSLTFIAS